MLQLQMRTKGSFRINVWFSHWWYQQKCCSVFSHIAPGRAMLVGRSTAGIVGLVFHETFTVPRGCILIILLIPWLFLLCHHVLKMFSTIHCCRQSRRDTDDICRQSIRLSPSKGTCMWVWICSIANTNGLFLKWPGQSLSSRARFSKTQANECAGF